MNEKDSSFSPSVVADGAPRAKPVVPFLTPTWGDIPATRWCIPPRPKAVVSCCRDEKVPPCLRRSGFAQAGLKLFQYPRSPSVRIDYFTPSQLWVQVIQMYPYTPLWKRGARGDFISIFLKSPFIPLCSPRKRWRSGPKGDKNTRD